MPLITTLANGSARGYGGLLAAAGAASSYESIATATGTGSSATVTFSSIPATYKHLQIRGIGRNDSATNKANIGVRLNGDTGNNYTYHILVGNGSTASSFGATATVYSYLGDSTGNSATSNIVAPIIIDIIDYASTTKNKTIRSTAGNELNSATTDADISLGSGLWLNTAAITSVSIFSNSGNWTTQTTFALYGIKG